MTLKLLSFFWSSEIEKFSSKITKSLRADLKTGPTQKIKLHMNRKMNLSRILFSTTSNFNLIWNKILKQEMVLGYINFIFSSFSLKKMGFTNTGRLQKKLENKTILCSNTYLFFNTDIDLLSFIFYINKIFIKNYPILL